MSSSLFGCDFVTSLITLMTTGITNLFLYRLRRASKATIYEYTNLYSLIGFFSETAILTKFFVILNVMSNDW